MCCRRPCGYVSLRVGVLVLAAVELAYDAMIFGLTAWFVTRTSYLHEVEEPQPQQVVAAVAQVIMCTIDLLFSVMLIHGVIKESVKQILAWWWWSSGKLVVTVGKLVWVIVGEVKNKRLVGLPFIITAIVITISIIFLVVVKAYVNYLKRKKLLPSLLRYEDDEDV
ncbi:hypothetical protein GWK47_048492 [Chionoecetes opilio]|uniref:Uncharacterized protein n=1 Tax=Chionoecetes opilio TaxID=41210 RepID=A0A8J4YFL5_CHIOP|nr:hypothetical protein GWK47_048492 [Chionoecetes opilio]